MWWDCHEKGKMPSSISLLEMKSQYSPALISAGQTSLECSAWSWILSSVGQRRPGEWLREGIPGGEETQARSQRDKWRNLGCLPRALKDLGEWSWFLCLRNSQVSMWIWPMWPSRVWPGPVSKKHYKISSQYWGEFCIGHSCPQMEWAVLRGNECPLLRLV